MAQLGFTAVIGTGFAGIFYDNTRKNGLALPIVTPEVRDHLMKLTVGDRTLAFQMDAATQSALIRGGDDNLDTLEYARAIHAFEARLTGKMHVSVIK